MKFLCLCYYDTRKFAELPPAELEKVGPACKPHDANLYATGKVSLVGSMSPTDQWRTIVPTDDGAVVSSGNYLPGSAQAGAFFLIEAADIDEATQIASKHPAANVCGHLGFAVEVRACDYFETF